MIRGKIYKNKENLIVLCTKTPYNDKFDGVILSSELQNDIRGLHSSLFNVNEFTEYIGILTLSNLHIKE